MESLLDAVMWIAHVGFAALWTGAILFLVGAIFPAARTGSLGVDALAMVVDRLRWTTRIGAVVFVVTGGHLAGTMYTVDSLVGTPRGQLVLAMLGLWLVLTAVIEIAGARIDTALADGSVDDALASTRSLFLLGAGLAVALLVDAGLLAAGAV